MQLDDKSHKVIYNVSAYEQETDEALKSLLRFVCSGEAGDSFTERINSLIEKAKRAESNKTEYMSMNLHDYDIQRIAKQEGREEGARENALDNARNFLSKSSLSPEMISDCCSLPLEDVLRLKAELEMTPSC